jgi:hypothetical protein
MSTEKVTWARASRDPRALVFLPWGHKGITIAKRDADGKLYGCRDVAHGLGFADILAAWIADARELPIEDKANARQTVVEYANKLLAKVAQ